MKSKFELRGAADSPIALLIHGRGGNIDIMRIFVRTIPEQWNLLFIEAPYEDKEIGGFSWWGVISIDQEEIYSQRVNSANFILDHLKTIMVDNSLNPSKVVALGFSQGSAILSYMLLTSRITLDGLAILAGFTLFPDEFSQNVDISTKIFWAHGIKDDVITLEKAKKGQNRLVDLGFDLNVVIEDVGHKIGVQGMKALTEWIKQF